MPRILVLGGDDVRQVLDMPSCVAAMESALGSLQQGELWQPLRTVIRPPGADELQGLMPAHRAGARPVFSLKHLVIASANASRGMDPHQGAVLLHDGSTGELVALLDASAITEIRTAAVSAVATRLLARPDAASVAILGSGVQARSHVIAMQAVLGDPELRIWSRTASHAEALALECHGLVCATVADALDGADVVCTCTSSSEPIVRLEWLTPGAHVNAVGASVPSARELETDVIAAAALYVDRRESTLAESGDFLLAAAEAGLGPDHIRAELGELLVGTATGRTTPDELTVFKSLGLAVEDLAAAELCVERARAEGIGTEVPF